ncbi:hypothetical protein MPER_09933, partial [Moniliophthora perniciosa FA553]
EVTTTNDLEWLISVQYGSIQFISTHTFDVVRAAGMTGYNFANPRNGFAIVLAERTNEWNTTIDPTDAWDNLCPIYDSLSEADLVIVAMLSTI